MHEFRTYLFEEFSRRKELNPSYSIRAFAKFLEVDQSTLSKFFKGRRSLHPRSINQCLEKLKTSPETVEDIREAMFKLTSEYSELQEAMLEAMSSWKHWAVLEFLKIDNEADSSSASRHFHFTLEETEVIFSQLEKLGFIKKEDDKFLLLKPNNQWISKSKTSEARRSLQKSLAGLSLEAIDKYEIKDRYHGSLTVAIDKNKLPEIKERISVFQNELGQYIQKNSSLNDVYQLTLSFFPLSEKEST